MSRATASTLDHQWDPYQILDVQRDRRCIGWAHSKRRKCRNTVNWNDMDAFYALLAELSSQPLDAAALHPRLENLASLGLCRQVHRRAQVDDMVEDWTRKIRNAVGIAELQAAMHYGRTQTSSTTASFGNAEAVHTPATNRSRSSTSTISAGSSPAAQAEIESTLRCLEANREQERVLMLRLASLQAPDAPRIEPIRPAIHASTTSVSSLDLSATPSVNSSRPILSYTSTTSHRSTSARSTSSRSDLNSSPSNPSSSPNHRRLPHTSADSPLHTRSTAPGFPAVSSSSSNSSAPLNAVPLASGPDHTPHITLLQQNLAGSLPPSTNSTATTPLPSPPLPPRCTVEHVRRLPVSEDCPICYDVMQGSTALEWCKGGCGQSVHKECMNIWSANCVANGTRVSCTMCRTEWTEGCEC